MTCTIIIIKKHTHKVKGKGVKGRGALHAESAFSARRDGRCALCPRIGAQGGKARLFPYGRARRSLRMSLRRSPSAHSARSSSVSRARPGTSVGSPFSSSATITR